MFIKYLVSVNCFFVFLIFFFKVSFTFFLQRILSSVFTLSVFLYSPTPKWIEPFCLGPQNCQQLSAESLGRSTKLCAIISVTKHLNSQKSHMTLNPWACICIFGDGIIEKLLESLLSSGSGGYSLPILLSNRLHLVDIGKRTVSKILSVHIWKSVWLRLGLVMCLYQPKNYSTVCKLSSSTFIHILFFNDHLLCTNVAVLGQT